MQPQSPNPNFDFVLKDKSQPKRSLPLTNLPKPIKIILAVVAGIIILIIISSLLSSRKNASIQPTVNVVVRDQEILRVTNLVQQQLPLQDPQTQSLAATVAASLKSDSVQLISYLANNNVKLSTAQLAADTDKTTDASLTAASQANNLDASYVAYLRTALTQYQTDLQTAYKSAGPNGKKLLAASFNSAQALLTSPPLKS